MAILTSHLTPLIKDEINIYKLPSKELKTMARGFKLT